MSRRGREDIITFVKHLKNGKQRFFHARGMVVGCSGTGKTSLLNRIQEKLHQVNHEIKETRAAEVNEHMFSIENGRLNGNFFLLINCIVLEIVYDIFIKGIKLSL